MNYSKILAKNDIINRLDTDAELKRAIMSKQKDFLNDTVSGEVSIGDMRGTAVFDRIFIGEPKEDSGVVLCVQVSDSGAGIQDGFKDVTVQIDFYVSLDLMDVPGALEINGEYYFYNRADYIMSKLIGLYSNLDIKGTSKVAEIVLSDEMPPFNENSKFNKNSFIITTQRMNFENRM